MCVLLIAPVWNWNCLHLRHIVWMWHRTFNRTSLELKPSLSGMARLSPSRLLIAPVWNWNRWWLRSACQQSLLLIAPVWNWNAVPLLGFAGSRFAFNRTSLELKRDSERASGRGSERLLIAPVWNWNCVLLRMVAGAPFLLLIAPVWNWNARRPCGRCSSCSLLIALVWNWNAFFFAWCALFSVRF